MARTDIFTSIRSFLSSKEPWAAAKACTNTYRIFGFQSMDFLLSFERYPFVATRLKEEEEEIMDCLHKHIHNLCISFNGFCTFLKNTHL
jgi:hypothetical protein